MNSPEEKAQDIVGKFRDIAQDWDERDLEWVDNIDKAKEISLICVDEIIAANVDNGYGYGNVKNDFWYKVKESIQNL